METSGKHHPPRQHVFLDQKTSYLCHVNYTTQHQNNKAVVVNLYGDQLKGLVLGAENISHNLSINP